MDWYPLYNSVRIAAVSTLVVYFLGIFWQTWWPAPRLLVKGALDIECSRFPWCFRPPSWATCC